LSNRSRRIIREVTRNAGLDGALDHLLSDDAVCIFKPHHRAYALAESAFGVKRESSLFVSSNAWDATGARYFGFPTCWVNRAGHAFEEMGQMPNWEVCDLKPLVKMSQNR
jgi:2-haloacid dehalogenase